MNQLNRFPLALALIALLASGSVLAHGEQQGAQHSTAVVKEQKPWGMPVTLNKSAAPSK